MPLLSISDALLFFTLLLNAVAIAKPRGGLKPAADRGGGGESNPAEPGSPDGARLGDDEGLAARAGRMLFAFRRCGVFIALWNFFLMVAMVTILA